MRNGASAGMVIHPVHIRRQSRVNDGRVLVAAAVAEALAHDALVPILTDYVTPSRPSYLLHTARASQPARLSAFIDHLLAAVAS